MSPAPQQIVVAAQMAQWPRVQDFVERFCAARRVAREDTLRLTLVAEELFTNSVEHGYRGGDAGASIRLELVAQAAGVRLLIEDGAPPFDPLAYAREHRPDPGLDPAARPPGGRGLMMVQRLAVEAHYVREAGCNRFWVTLAVSAPAPG